MKRMHRNHLMSGLALLLAAMTAASTPARAGWDWFGTSNETKGLPDSFRDTYAEYRIAREIAADPKALQMRNVRVLGFGNTFLILGDVSSEALRNRVDKLVLQTTGVERRPKTVNTATVESRECVQKSTAVNSKRRFNLAGADGDCSLLIRSDPEATPTGQIYNRLVVADNHSALQRARDQLLAARARSELVSAGFDQAMDGTRMRLDAQDGVVYILVSPRTGDVDEIAERLQRLDGVRDLAIFPETQNPAL